MLPKAIAAYKKAIAIDFEHADAHYNLALAYYFNGQYGLAIKHCDKAVELGAKVRSKFLKLLKPYRK